MLSQLEFGPQLVARPDRSRLDLLAQVFGDLPVHGTCHRPSSPLDLPLIGVILPVQTAHAIQPSRIFGISGFIPNRTLVTPRRDTKGWDGLDGRVHRIYPSSPTAWLHQDLPYGSAQWNSRAQQDVSNRMHRSWTDGDAVAREHQARESASPGRVAEGRTPRLVH